MKKQLPLFSKMVWKGSLLFVSYLLFAACMQHDESLAPRNADLVSELKTSGLDAGVSATMKRTFTAHLNSANEVPAAASDGQGQAIFKLSEDGTTLHYKLIVANIKDVTQAHIHCAEAGVNGAAFVFLYGFNAAGATVNGILAEGDITSADIIPLSDRPTCVGGVQTFEDLIRLLQTGGAYVNVHTLAYRGGEIRGQIH